MARAFVSIECSYSLPDRHSPVLQVRTRGATAVMPPAAVFLASDAANMVSGAEYEVTGGDSAKNV